MSDQEMSQSPSNDQVIDVDNELDSVENEEDDVIHCMYHIAGFCENGDECSFYHEENKDVLSELRASREPCVYFMKGYCSYGNNCIRSHDIKIVTNDDNGIKQDSKNNNNDDDVENEQFKKKYEKRRKKLFKRVEKEKRKLKKCRKCSAYYHTVCNFCE